MNMATTGKGIQPTTFSTVQPYMSMQAGRTTPINKDSFSACLRGHAASFANLLLDRVVCPSTSNKSGADIPDIRSNIQETGLDGRGQMKAWAESGQSGLMSEANTYSTPDDEDAMAVAIVRLACWETSTTTRFGFTGLAMSYQRLRGGESFDDTSIHPTRSTFPPFPSARISQPTSQSCLLDTENTW